MVFPYTNALYLTIVRNRNHTVKIQNINITIIFIEDLNNSTQQR